MQKNSSAVWLKSDDGWQARVPEGDFLIGRAPMCDLQTEDTHASWVHALIRNTGGSVQVLPVGRNPTFVNKQKITAVRPLANGDRIDVPGVRVDLVQQAAARAVPLWSLRCGALSVGVGRKRVSVGGDGSDDLYIDGIPGASAVFYRAGTALLVELAQAGVVGGNEVPPGELVEADHNTEVQFNGRRIQVIRPAAWEEAGHPPPPTQVATAFDAADLLPELMTLQGQRLDLRYRDGGNVRVALRADAAEVAAALIAQAMTPQYGAAVSDADIFAALWPALAPQDADEALNAALQQLRRQLLEAGLNPLHLLHRDWRARTTRLRVAGPDSVELRQVDPVAQEG